MAVTDVNSPAIACIVTVILAVTWLVTYSTGGLNSRPPELTAVARAGANVTVSWTGIVKMHNGPVMSVSHCEYSSS
jgi:hypothetical protein